MPIVPGILPILSTSQIKRFVSLCGAALPAPLVAELEKRGDDDEAVTQFGVFLFQTFHPDCIAGFSLRVRFGRSGCHDND